MSLTEIKKPKLIVILGPTAVGKTKLGIEVAKNIDASIINADSLQVYKYLNIGTAKPTLQQRKAIPHYLIDVVNPDEKFNAGIFRKLALSEINKLIAHNKKIVIVGGTFLYVKVLLYGILEGISTDEEIRNELKSIRKVKGTHFLYEKLKDIDLESAQRINPNDYVRIERALEVFHLTGEKISYHQKKHAFNDNKFDVLKVGLKVERETIRSKIDKRVDKMIDMGFIDEVKGLREMGYSPNLKPMQSIGYKTINQYLDGNINLPNAIETIKRDTKRFSKRQMTWLRADNEIDWFELSSDLKKIIDKSIEFYN